MSVTLSDSVIKVSEKYYPQILLKECKYAVKWKIINAITEELNLDESASEFVMKIMKIKILLWWFFYFYGFNSVWLKYNINY